MAKILLVEDDPQITTLYSLKLLQVGFELMCAGNGLEALKSLATYTPDLVLLDLRMPVMNGDEFLERFRKMTDFQQTPVIVLTNISRSEAPQTIWHHGISEYIVKAHTTPKEIVEIINRTLVA